PTCKYGEKCYRKNAEHVKEFHSEELKKEEEKEGEEIVKEPTTKRRKMKDESEEEKEKEVNVKRKKEKEEEESKEEGELSCDVEEDIEIVEEVEGDVDDETVPHKAQKAYPHREPFLTQPSGIYALWNKAQAIDPEDPRNAFSEIGGARLVGFFDFLAGDLDGATDDEIRLHARFPTDLPEMQTIIVTDTGRYALWRDDPKQNQAIVVHTKHSEDHFPKITMVGDKPVHALVHAAGEGAEAMLERFFPVSENKWSNVEHLKRDIKVSVGRRNKISVGRPLHGMRLWVYVDSNEVGYRALGEDLNKLKRTMTILGETTDDVVRKKKMAEMREIATFVQLATDECDFGTTLEFGHDLFVSNFETIDAMAKRNLTMAYKLLGRDEFVAIVEAQMAPQMRRREKIMVTE
ncbi:hypothetical protein PFISCL1PPCAC_16000, partial [Pristionchus fissidentatus]